MRNVLVFALLFVAGAGLSAPKVLRIHRDDRVHRAGGRAFAKLAGDGYVPSVFEFAPANGTGMGVACAGTTPTGYAGETMTFTRATAASCLKSNSASIANGDLVALTSGQPAVMPGPDGTTINGILVEEARTNTALRSAELCDAAWTDTATCASDTTVGPWGTQTMDTLTDASGVTSDGATQAITTASATMHSFACDIKAGSSARARVAITGVGDSTGDCSTTSGVLSSTAATRVSCSSAAAFGGTLTAVTVSVLVGTADADTGSIIVENCQHEVAAGMPTSHIVTSGVAATRNAVKASFTQSASLGTVLCIGAKTRSVAIPSTSGHPRILALKSTGGDYIDCYKRTDVVVVGIDATLSGAGRGTAGGGPGWVSGTANRAACSLIDATTLGRSVAGTVTTNAVAAYTAPTWNSAVLWLGDYFSGNYQANGVVKQVKVGLTATECD